MADRRLHPVEQIAEAVAGEWLELASLLREHHAIGAAVAYDKCAAKLRERSAAYLDEAIDADDAAEESGYTAHHIRRLIKEGLLPNVGTETRPRVLRRYLPLKPGSTVPVPSEEPPPPRKVGGEFISPKTEAVLKSLGKLPEE
jgi:hypothetical protein